jgi:hypothetical protein
LMVPTLVPVALAAAAAAAEGASGAGAAAGGPAAGAAWARAKRERPNTTARVRRANLLVVTLLIIGCFELLRIFRNAGSFQLAGLNEKLIATRAYQSSDLKI